MSSWPGSWTRREDLGAGADDMVSAEGLEERYVVPLHALSLFLSFFEFCLRWTGAAFLFAGVLFVGTGRAFLWSVESRQRRRRGTRGAGSTRAMSRTMSCPAAPMDPLYLPRVVPFVATIQLVLVLVCFRSALHFLPTLRGAA
ncbi:hypothetical protein B0H16DRAFT_1645467 [Mycena metata]|uniref:Uncharacterized protein n=1 Tax=Mycena metata TaxID=1033252 RepID=A0AAD7DUM1_9AGAR|nr:hypothetical protein B0H16DRAFT_1645467 [Mycena metata]